MNLYNFEFIIPLKRDDLLTSQTSEQYYVSEVYHYNELEQKIVECKVSLKECGCDFVLEHFGTLFSVLQNFKNLDFKFLQSFYSGVIIEGLQQLNNTLCLLFEEEDLHSETRIKMLAIMKMILYISVEFLKSFQEKVDQTYSLVIDKKGKKNTKLMKLKEDHNWDWEENERVALHLIYKIVKLSLHRLWDPPMAEEEFVRMIGDCCYSVLEKPSITSVKMKPTRDILFDILATLITQYNNVISCKVKIVQMLKLHEHLVSVLAQAVMFFVENYNCRSFVKEIIVEIIETGTEMDCYGQDNSSSRLFSNFIVEIATQQPQLILPCVELLIHNLNCDPYTMRICVLTVMAEIVSNVLHSESEDSLTEENRKTRDTFLEHLLDHIVDVNVFVRSRVLKLWQGLFNQKAIPKHFIILLLDLTIQRLNDKSSNVVKYAIQLVTLMLQNNLYGASLNEETVKQNLRAIKSQVMETESRSENPSMFKFWFCNRSEFSEFIVHKLKDHVGVSNDDPESNDSESENENDTDCEYDKSALIEQMSRIRNSVIKCEFELTFVALKEFEEKYLRKAKIFEKVSDVVQYYQWILGNICKEDESSLIILTIVKCSNVNELKSLINQPIVAEDLADVEFGAHRALITYCEDFLKFVETMRTATSVIGEIMMNRSTIEVLEAIEFFKVSRAFHLSGAEEGLRNMLLLINSKESGIKDAVVNAYKIMYLQTEHADQYEAAIVAVEQLIFLLRRVTYEQKQAISDLIKQWVINNDIGTEFILVLWDKYSRQFPNTTVDDSRAAAVLISMYASGKPEVVKSNIELLTKYGLGLENRKNYTLILFTCQTFRALSGAKNEAGVLIKYPQDSELIESLVNFIVEQFTNFDNTLYPKIMIEVTTSIYQLSESPDNICEKMIKEISKNIRNQCENDVEEKATFNEELLIRLILLIGHIAFCHWQYLENDVLGELKRRSSDMKLKWMNDKRKNRNDSRNKSTNISSNKKCLTESSVTDNFEDDNMAVADERITESVRMVCENEILMGNSLLSALSSLVIKVCQNPEKYPGNRLQSAASISLSKMMMTSSEFCNSYIQLFITMLEKTKQPEVKTNLILAFGDLTFKFPNTIEPWTGYFYNRLKDNSSQVRYTALLVISHLITNEMVKVKGQMSDVALCLVDSDITIKNHAFHLFHELSMKGNSLYNVMPDIISRLSHPDYRTSEENFQTILKILMKLIVKDRHLEAIVEKLCHRFGGAADERQCIDLSYCLTLVTYTDRILQKLIDNIACYAEKLNCARVHKNFTNILIACKRQSKLNKMADLVLELENKIEIILTKGIDNLDADFLKPPKTPAKTPKTPRFCKSTAISARKLRMKNSRRIMMKSISDESEGSEE